MRTSCYLAGNEKIGAYNGSRPHRSRTQETGVTGILEGKVALISVDGGQAIAIGGD